MRAPKSNLDNWYCQSTFKALEQGKGFFFFCEPFQLVVKWRAWWMRGRHGWWGRESATVHCIALLGQRKWRIVRLCWPQPCKWATIVGAGAPHWVSRQCPAFPLQWPVSAGHDGETCFVCTHVQYLFSSNVAVLPRIHWLTQGPFCLDDLCVCMLGHPRNWGQEVVIPVSRLFTVFFFFLPFCTPLPDWLPEFVGSARVYFCSITPFSGFTVSWAAVQRKCLQSSILKYMKTSDENDHS